MLVNEYIRSVVGASGSSINAIPLVHKYVLAMRGEQIRALRRYYAICMDAIFSAYALELAASRSRHDDALWPFANWLCSRIDARIECAYVLQTKQKHTELAHVTRDECNMMYTQHKNAQKYMGTRLRVISAMIGSLFQTLLETILSIFRFVKMYNNRIDVVVCLKCKEIVSRIAIVMSR